MLASPIVSKSVLLSSFALTRPAASGLAAPFVRLLNSKIPSESTKPAHQRPSSSSSRQGEPAGGDLGLDGETVSLLERLSLVDFGNVEAIHRLGEAVDFAKPLSEVYYWKITRSHHVSSFFVNALLLRLIPRVWNPSSLFWRKRP